MIPCYKLTKIGGSYAALSTSDATYDNLQIKSDYREDNFIDRPAARSPH